MALRTCESSVLRQTFTTLRMARIAAIATTPCSTHRSAWPLPAPVHELDIFKFTKARKEDAPARSQSASHDGRKGGPAKKRGATWGGNVGLAQGAQLASVWRGWSELR